MAAPDPIPLDTPHRLRRRRAHRGWRARMASWLRWLADRINPLENP